MSPNTRRSCVRAEHLTRQSISFAKRFCEAMDPRVKPAGDARERISAEPIRNGNRLVSRFRNSHHCVTHSFANFGIKGTLAIYDSSAEAREHAGQRSTHDGLRRLPAIRN